MPTDPSDREATRPSVANPYKDEIVISWPELHRDARYLSRLLHEISDDWKGIIAITRGGLVPAALIARELDLRLIDTVCVVSYGATGAEAEMIQGELKWLKTVQGDGDGFLLIDDLVDTGRTARAVREELPKAHFATLYAKPLGRAVVDTFVKEFKQEKWIYFPWDIDYRFVSPIRSRGDAPR